jgi:hypothetical protein
MTTAVRLGSTAKINIWQRIVDNSLGGLDQLLQIVMSIALLTILR